MNQYQIKYKYVSTLYTHLIESRISIKITFILIKKADRI